MSYRRNIRGNTTATSSNNARSIKDSDETYEIFEEEVVEDNDEYHKGDEEYDSEEIEEEEELVEVIEVVIEDERTSQLPGISEEEDEEDHTGDNKSYSHSNRSFCSTTEVEVYEQEVEEDVIEEVYEQEETVREDDDNHNIFPGREFMKSCSVGSSGSGTTSKSRNAVNRPEDTSSDDDDGDGDASAAELSEAIEYVLRQEKAVSRFILSEEQASKMAHLPIKIMKIIVDHLETCDNAHIPIDWDFLLKIVMPFLEQDDDPDNEEDPTTTAAVCGGLPCNV